MPDNTRSLLRLFPDYSRLLEPLRHTWSGIVNIDQFKWLGREDVHEALSMAHDEIGARHVRAAGMFGFDSRVFDVDPGSFLDPGPRKPRLNFQIINYYFDSCVDRGVVPMITTCFTPEGMATGSQLTFDNSCNITPPRDPHEWENLVHQLVSQLVRRYGKTFMRQCWFEVWNEPNLEGSFWTGGQKRWMALWKSTFRTIKDVDPEFRVGGPSSARGEWVRDLLEFGRANDCRPDYLTCHCYNNDSVDAPLSPFSGPAWDKVNKSPGFLSGVVRSVRDIARDEGFRGEIHWNEWGSSWHPCDFDRESENEAAFIVKTMAEVSQEADQFAYWNLSDIYNQVGYGRDTFHGNYGMLNLQNIRKPSYHAHQLLCRLGGGRRPVQAEGGSDCLNALFSETGDSSHVLIYNYQAADSPAPPPCLVEIHLPEDLPFHAPVLFRVNHTENNAVTRWRGDGCVRYLSPPKVRRHRRESELAEAPPSDLETVRADGARRVRFGMPGRGIALLEWNHGENSASSPIVSRSAEEKQI